MALEAFEVQYVSNPLGPPTYKIDDRRVDQLWMPLTGPTPVALLRLLHDELEDAAHDGWGAVRYLDVADVAARIGVNPKRALHSLYRLVQFALISEDETTTEDVPRFLVPMRVREVDDKTWPRLPAVVRQRYADFDLR